MRMRVDAKKNEDSHIKEWREPACNHNAVHRVLGTHSEMRWSERARAHTRFACTERIVWVRAHTKQKKITTNLVCLVLQCKRHSMFWRSLSLSLSLSRSLVLHPPASNDYSFVFITYYVFLIPDCIVAFFMIQLRVNSTFQDNKHA